MNEQQIEKTARACYGSGDSIQHPQPPAPVTDARTMLQDDGRREYLCSSMSCGYDGKSYCQNCGFEAGEFRHEP